MKLAELGDCRGTKEKVPTQYCSRVRVCLHNLLKASESDAKLDPDIRFVLESFLDATERELGVDATRIHIDQVYRKFVTTMARNAAKLLFKREGDLSTYQDQTLISLQPLWAFEFWLDDDPFSRKPEYSAASITHLSKVAQANLTVERADVFAKEKLASARVIGMPGGVVFLTPNAATVAHLHQKVTAIFAARKVYDEDALEALDAATRLRNLLGLYRRNETEPVVLLETNDTIAKLQHEARRVKGGTKNTAAAAPFRIAAPTQFDAGDYPRFRYWPNEPKAPAPDFGRTWDLDKAVTAADQQCGAPEVVVTPMAVSRISNIVPAGRVYVDAAAHVETDEEDAAFADMICAGRSLADLAVSLGSRFSL